MEPDDAFVEFRNVRFRFDDSIAKGHVGWTVHHQPVPECQCGPNIVFVVRGDGTEASFVTIGHIALILDDRTCTFVDLLTALKSVSRSRDFSPYDSAPT